MEQENQNANAAINADLKKRCLAKAKELGIAEEVASAEFTSFMQRIEENTVAVADLLKRGKSAKYLVSCSFESKVMAFVHVLSCKLSFHVMKDQIYLQVKKGTDNVMEATPSPDGMAVMAIYEGIVTGYGPAKVVFDYELRQCLDKNGNTVEAVHVENGQLVRHISFVGVPPAQKTIVGGYIEIHLKNGKTITPYFDYSQIQEWRNKSTNQAMYDTIGMVRAKIKKHAFSALSGVSEGELEGVDTSTGEVVASPQKWASLTQHIAETPHIAESPEAPF
jgi:hypothetical protein